MENHKYTCNELAKKYILRNFKELSEIEKLIQMCRLFGIDDDTILKNKVEFTDDILSSLKHIVINNLHEEFELNIDDMSINSYEIVIYRSNAFKLTNPLMYDKLILKLKTLPYELCLL